MPDNMPDMNIRGKHDYAHSDFVAAGLMRHSRRMNIAPIRKSRSLTQVDLAEMTNLTQSTISRAEKGDDGVTLGNYKAIAEALNVHLSDLFADGRTSAEQAIIDAYRHLPPDRRKGWQDALGIASKDRG